MFESTSAKQNNSSLKTADQDLHSQSESINGLTIYESCDQSGWNSLFTELWLINLSSRKRVLFVHHIV